MGVTAPSGAVLGRHGVDGHFDMVEGNTVSASTMLLAKQCWSTPGVLCSRCP